MRPIAKPWLGGALVLVAGASLALLALMEQARAEIAFTPERVHLLCAGAAPEPLKGHGNAVEVPALTDAQLGDCRVEIEFSVRETALAEQAATSGYLELMGLRLTRAAYPTRFAVNGDGISLTPRPGGGLTLTLAAKTLFGGDRQRGVALILAWRSDGGAAARAVLSPTLLIERAEPPTELRAKRHVD